MLKSIKIKVYGESLKIHRIGFKGRDLPRFKTVIKNMNEPLEYLLLDAFFYKNLGISEIQSIQDLICHSAGGLINNHKAQIEIWSGRKRLNTFKLEELIRHTTLFPLYKVEVIQMDVTTIKKGVFYEEKEIGMVGIYEIPIDNFHIDLLQFYILTIENSKVELLDSINYENKKLIQIKSDTLVTYQCCFEQK